MTALARAAPSKPNEEKDETQSSPFLRRRRLHGGKRSVLLFLTTLILLSFSLTLGQIDKSAGEPGRANSEHDLQSDREGNTVDVQLERDSTRTRRASPKKIHIVDPTRNFLELLSSPRSNGSQHRVWIVLAYRDTCEYSIELLRKLTDDAIPRIEFSNDEGLDDRKLHSPEMIFVPMPIDDNEVGIDSKKQFLNRIGIARLPSLFFLRDEEQESENTLLLENASVAAEVYRGRSESVSDLVNGLYHYLSRLQFPPSPLLQNQEHHHYGGDRSSPLTAIRVESLRELQNIIRNVKEFKILQSSPLPLDPGLSEHDEKWIRYIMDDDSGMTNCRSTYNFYHFGTNDKINHLEKDDRTDDIQSCQQRLSTRQGPYRVIVQCRNYMGSKAQQVSSPHSIVQLYQEYDQAIKVLGTRRDILFSILELHLEDTGSSEVSRFCNSPGDDGLVKVLGFLSNESIAGVENDKARKQEFFEEKLNNSTRILSQLSSRLMPEVMWFDRRMTAPIAFHPRYRRHAILFVDLHDRNSASKSRDAIRLFRQECRQLQLGQQIQTNTLKSILNHSVEVATDSSNDEDRVVCLVVPSTEIRFLNTFGIDIWSNLDRQATEKLKGTLCNNQNWKDDNYDVCGNFEGESNASSFSSVLPALVLTDRQNNGAIMRYYLDRLINSRSLSDFVNDFVNGQIKPEMKSGRISANYYNIMNGTNKFPTNKYFVNLLTAKSLRQFLESNRDKHVLVELYAPTCGHCKRFNTIWNSLGRLVEFLGWSDQLLLARVDVTSNEIMIPGMAAAWLPDVFYFGVGVSENPIHYDKTPFADDAELGSISDPLEVLEWWMDEAAGAINETEFLHSLDKIIAPGTFSRTA